MKTVPSTNEEFLNQPISFGANQGTDLMKTKKPKNKKKKQGIRPQSQDI